MRTIVSLAHNLDMNVIAEGVETQAQVDALQAIGDIEFQGYYFSRPLRPSALAGWQHHHQSRTTTPAATGTPPNANAGQLG